MKKWKRVPYSKMDGVMWRLNHEIPTECILNFTRLVDMTAVEMMRQEAAENGKTKPSYTAVLIKAIAAAVKKYPYTNRRIFRRYLFQRAIEFSDINVSIAVEQEDEIMQAGVETFYRADQYSMENIMKRLISMREPNSPMRERWKKFSNLVDRLPRFLSSWLAAVPRFFPDLWLEHRGGAFLITSPSKYGVDAIGGFWHWPVTFNYGLVKKRPVVVREVIEARQTMSLGMIFDGRIMAGAPAAKFFNEVVKNLECPDLWNETFQKPGKKTVEMEESVLSA